MDEGKGNNRNIICASIGYNDITLPNSRKYLILAIYPSKNDFINIKIDQS